MKIDETKISIQSGFATSSSMRDPIVIKYQGEGGASIPESMWSDIINDKNYGNSIVNNPKKILLEAIRHSQFVDFEPVV